MKVKFKPQKRLKKVKVKFKPEKRLKKVKFKPELRASAVASLSVAGSAVPPPTPPRDYASSGVTRTTISLPYRYHHSSSWNSSRVLPPQSDYLTPCFFSSGAPGLQPYTLAPQGRAVHQEEATYCEIPAHTQTKPEAPPRRKRSGSVSVENTSEV